LLVLSKIAKNFVFFFLFYYSFHVPDSGINEQFLRIFPTLALENIAQIQKYNTPDSGISEYFRKN
jgi:hypothetical protein